jgi:hypothetical protein
MSRGISKKAATLAKAAILFRQKAHAAFPGSVIEPIDQPSRDEDLTLEVQLPAGTDVRHASDELLRIALEVEDRYGVTILTGAVPDKGASG